MHSTVRNSLICTLISAISLTTVPAAVLATVSEAPGVFPHGDQRIDLYQVTETADGIAVESVQTLSLSSRDDVSMGRVWPDGGALTFGHEDSSPAFERLSEMGLSDQDIDPSSLRLQSRAMTLDCLRVGSPALSREDWLAPSSRDTWLARPDLRMSSPASFGPGSIDPLRRLIWGKATWSLDSADGDVSDPSFFNSLAVVDLISGEPMMIAGGPDDPMMIASPTWSPSGQRLAFRTAESQPWFWDGNRSAPDHAAGWDVRIWDNETGEIVTVAPRGFHTMAFSGAPALWSPDETRLVFSGQLETHTPDSQRTEGLCLVDRISGEMRRLSPPRCPDTALLWVLGTDLILVMDGHDYLWDEGGQQFRFNDALTLEDERITLRSLSDWQSPAWELRGYYHEFGSLQQFAVSPDGRFIALCGIQGTGPERVSRLHLLDLARLDQSPILIEEVQGLSWSQLIWLDEGFVEH
jgi:WD40-like Beta Propeller Repeat